MNQVHRAGPGETHPVGSGKSGARSVVVWRRRSGAARLDRGAEKDRHGRRGGDNAYGRTRGFPRRHDGRETALDRNVGRRWVFGAPRVTPNVHLERPVDETDRPPNHRVGEVQGEANCNRQRDPAEAHDGHIIAKDPDNAKRRASLQLTENSVCLFVVH